MLKNMYVVSPLSKIFRDIYYNNSKFIAFLFDCISSLALTLSRKIGVFDQHKYIISSVFFLSNSFVSTVKTLILYVNSILYAHTYV